MPLKDDYSRALQESDLSMRAGNIDSRNYLLIHSTADTIVHEQHSLIWSKALIDEGVGFRHQVITFWKNFNAFFLTHLLFPKFQIYTDEDHRLEGALFHLYKTIDWFLEESFGPIESNDWEPTGFFAFKQ